MGENLADVLNSIEVDDVASSAGDDEEESFMDPDQAVVTKVKRWDYEMYCSSYFKPWRTCFDVWLLAHFPLHQNNVWNGFSFDLSKPISIKEAIFALDYIDHDFYVFRDEESNEVSVVYKRNAGGVGLIQPEQ